MFDGTEIDCVEAARITTVTIKSGSARRILLRVLTRRPSTVRRNTSAVIEAVSSEEFDAAASAWRFDEASGFVLVKFLNPAGTTAVVLTP
jgi:hypothetical protein